MMRLVQEHAELLLVGKDLGGARAHEQKNVSCSRIIACGTSAPRSTNVTFRRDAACETMRSGMRSSAVTARPNSAASDRRFSPTAQMIAISRSQLTSAKFRRL